ncbi:MAG: MBL fold metallo-hydrolase [candidate division Zixibacteria bacterium]|nr:MBL fold metallo-hydrolase [candidate division Zixibacteria bacterium]
MKIKFLGGTKSVTGSMHILESEGKKVLIDCGLFQGRREESNQRNKSLPFEPQSIERMVLSHAHLDHSGNIPTLVKNGYRNTIYSTFATRDLCLLMLRDSANLQEKDAEYLNKRNEKKGAQIISPLYTVEEAEKSLEQFKGVAYNRFFYITSNVRVTFYDAGHILGSALSYFEVFENGKKTRILYAVDLGRKKMPILKDPVQVKNIDYLILESTYGSRLHEDFGTTADRLAQIINRTYLRGGKIIVPAFALERTQEIIYCLHLLEKEGRIPKLPVYVDSPLAVNVTEVFKLHPECFDKETKMILEKEENPFGLKRITYITDPEESKKLNRLDESCMIISGSGMCEGGRILHHLKNNIEDPKNTILVVGYMAENTLGRRIVEKYPKVKIFGEEYNLESEVVVLNSFSAHADKNELLQYVEQTQNNLRGVFLVHGEEKESQALKESIESVGIQNVRIPDRGEEIIL